MSGAWGLGGLSFRRWLVHEDWSSGERERARERREREARDREAGILGIIPAWNLAGPASLRGAHCGGRIVGGASFKTCAIPLQERGEQLKRF